MRYQHLKTTRKLRRYIVPVFPVAIALLLVLTKAEVPTFFTNISHTIARPFWSLRDALSATAVATQTSLKSHQALIEENTQLYRELSRLQREAYTAEALSFDNERLRTLLGRESDSEALLFASVIHGESFSPYDTFIIDIGAKQGVRDNMLVLSQEKIAIGSVTSTLENSAIVTRFSAPSMVADVILNATTSLHTNLRGYGGGSMRLSIPRDIALSVGDTLTLPNFATYPIGTVASVEETPEGAYKIVHVQSPVNIYEVRFVILDTAATWKKVDEVMPIEPEIVSEDEEQT